VLCRGKLIITILSLHNFTGKEGVDTTLDASLVLVSVLVLPLVLVLVPVLLLLLLLLLLLVLIVTVPYLVPG